MHVMLHLMQVPLSLMMTWMMMHTCETMYHVIVVLDACCKQMFHSSAALAAPAGCAAQDPATSGGWVPMLNLPYASFVTPAEYTAAWCVGAWAGGLPMGRHH